MTDLLSEVESDLVPVLAPLGFRVVDSEVSDHFDNATVVLEGRGLRLQILRERGVVSLDIAPSFAPTAWVDSAVLMEHLGLAKDSGLQVTDASDMMRGVGRFVSAMLPELQSIFGERRWGESRARLEALKRDRADRLFGS